MSAIWGLLSGEDITPEKASPLMQEPFLKNCKLDAYGSLHTGQLLFGCGIQHITEESIGEKLPLRYRDPDFFLTADCLLDNREELLKTLSLPASTPDGGLLAGAYARFGISFLTHLRGLFSIAIYDTASGTLYLAVDQLASRCLYYYHRGNTTAFSTLSASIRAVFPEIPANGLFIKDFLTAPGLAPNITSRDTPYEGIYKCNPGTFLEIRGEALTEHTYWTPALLPEKPLKSAAEYNARFLILYRNCVRDALRCNGEAGLCLSSGLDSASIGALAASLLAKEKRCLNTYTYVPQESTSPGKNRNHIHNEEPAVRSITALYPNMVPHFFNRGGKNCLEPLPEELSILEIPLKAFVNLPNLTEICEAAVSDGCKVLLTGQAGNSTVSYGYIDDILCSLYQEGHILTFLSWLNRYALHVGESRKKALKSCLGYYHAASLAAGDLKKHPAEADIPTLSNPFVSPEILSGYPLTERHGKNAPNPLPGFPMSRESYRNWVWFAPFLSYIGEFETKLGLHYGLVFRDPTRDCRMIHFCYHLPYRYFAYQGTPRFLIRSAMKGRLPDAILDNWTRYGVQNADWFTRIRRDWASLRPAMEKVLFSEKEIPFLCRKALSDFWAHCKEELVPEDEEPFLYLCFFYILALHL